MLKWETSAAKVIGPIKNSKTEGRKKYIFFTFQTSVDAEVHSSVRRSVTAATACDSRHDLTSKPKTIVPFFPLSGAIHLNQSDLLILSADLNKKKTENLQTHFVPVVWGCSPGETNLVVQLLGRHREPDLLWLPGRHLVVLLRGGTLPFWTCLDGTKFERHQIWTLVAKPGTRTPSHHLSIKRIYIVSVALKPRPSLPGVQGSLLLPQLIFCEDSLRPCDSASC